MLTHQRAQRHVLISICEAIVHAQPWQTNPGWLAVPAPMHCTRNSSCGAVVLCPLPAASAALGRVLTVLMSNFTPGRSCSAMEMAVRVCSVSSPHSMLLRPLARAMNMMSWSCSLHNQNTMGSVSMCVFGGRGCIHRHKHATRRVSSTPCVCHCPVHGAGQVQPPSCS